MPLPPPPAPPRRRRRTGLVVAGLVATVLVATGGGIAWWALGDDPAPQRTTSAEAEEPEDPTDLEGVADRYANLAEDVTAGVTACELVEDTPAGVTERLRCSLPEASLELTTFESADDLLAARTAVLDTEVGTISDVTADRAYFGFDPDNGGTADPAVVYWDLAAARQSGHVVAATPDHPYEDLSADVAETGPVVGEPSEPAHPRLIRLLAGLGIGDCSRIPTFGDGETEENLCSRDGYDVYAAAFGTEAELLRYRVDVRSRQREDRVYTGSSVYCYSLDADPVCPSVEGERVLGRILGYVSEDGQEDESGVLYLDHVRCGCYVEVWGREGVGRGDPNALQPVLFPLTRGAVEGTATARTGWLV
ncbi:hypothetical protein [Nocardioides sp. TF02-7]|uniref:hypothetical protein n=1 Tax=Nocardioides sp. TF02-7 TaxID=2917724 RepID=UPI001F057B00|nr:hypothetical protein [Nocardioides sp. TF02-7]UMG92991.1 hypothetical protein MF408_01125 [Nocardioides sp. TF02-7]